MKNAVATTHQTASILIVDDDEGMLHLMAEALRAEGWEIATAISAKAARLALKTRAPDLMLLDLKLQDADGPAFILRLQEENRWCRSSSSPVRGMRKSQSR